MKDIRILLSILFFMGGCAQLPEIEPSTVQDTQALQEECSDVFLSGKWRFVHSISVDMPGNRQGSVLGVTVVSAEAQTIDCAIMNVEGFVFFDACMDKKLTIRRAVPPFDSEEFAQGLMRDIQFIFFDPKGRLLETGLVKDGSSVCRYGLACGGLMDVIHHPDRSWEIRKYDKDQKLTRTVHALWPINLGSAKTFRIPERLELEAYGPHSYELTMKLMEAERLSR